MYYKCRNFEIYELVDSVTYSKFGEEAWMFFNTNALKALDGIREYFGTPVTVNTWKNGGNFEFRGLRPISSTLGATYSQHRFGNAFDCDIKGKTAIEVRTEIINKEKPSKNMDTGRRMKITKIDDDKIEGIDLETKKKIYGTKEEFLIA